MTSIKMGRRRGRRLVVLDVLLCARHPKTRTQLLHDANLNNNIIEKYLKVMINDGYIEKRTVDRMLGKERRTDRRRMGLDPYISTRRGKHWYKTSRKGEAYIADMKAMWEAGGCHPEFKGIHSFDYTGRDTHMKPPQPNRFNEGLDPAWVNEVYIPPVKLRRDMKIGYIGR